MAKIMIIIGMCNKNLKKSIHNLIIVEALAHNFIHHNATGYRYIEGVDITELWDFDESIAQFHHLARDAFDF